MRPTSRPTVLAMFLTKRSVAVSGRSVTLTPNEFRLLALLAQNEGKLLTHRTILREVWGPAYQSETNYLRVYMAQLRRKLEQDPSHPRHLITEPGMGYRFHPAVAAD